MEETKPTRKETTLREEDAGDLNEYALGSVLHRRTIDITVGRLLDIER